MEANSVRSEGALVAYKSRDSGKRMQKDVAIPLAAPDLLPLAPARVMVEVAASGALVDGPARADAATRVPLLLGAAVALVRLVFVATLAHAVLRLVVLFLGAVLRRNECDCQPAAG